MHSESKVINKDLKSANLIDNSKKEESLKDAKQGIRLCVGCNQLLPKTQLVKITARKNCSEGLFPIVIDWKKQIPGRSTYIYPSKSCLNRFLSSNRRKSFGRLTSFSKQIKQIHLNSIIQELESNSLVITNFICPSDSSHSSSLPIVHQDSLKAARKGGCTK